jgi:hypothetical protein
MSDQRNEPTPEDRAEPPITSEPVAAEKTPSGAPPPPPSPRTARSTAAIWLTGLLVLVIGAAVPSPFWAPAVGPLLPWSKAPAPTDYDALAARIAALEQRPTTPTIDVDAIRSAQAGTDKRVAALETAISTLHLDREPAAATKATMAQLARRIDGIETQTASRAAAEAAEIQNIRQELTRRGAANSDLVDRLAALEHQVQAQGNADRSGSVLLLALLQMREAVEEARPFPAEYAAFKQLAVGDPELAATAEPLADAARDGLASRAVLRQRLTDLAGVIATVRASSTKSKWWAQALDQLRGLVTIRHIDSGVKTGPEAAVGAAEADLAQGDLAAAVAGLDKLTGTNAEAAQPWLRMARQRLSAETALTHLQELLTARLGSAPTAAPAATIPSAAPAQPPAASRNPS